MNSNRIVIIGGGISGLAAAYYLSRFSKEYSVPLEIFVLEASGRFGGVIETLSVPNGLFEVGPDSFLSEKTAALELCRDLKIEQDLIGTNPDPASHVFSKNRLFRIPEGFYLVAPVHPKTLFHLPFMSWPGKIRMALEPWVPARSGGGDESIGDFIRRRFGHETLLKIGQPMMGAMVAGDVGKLSLEAVFPRFKKMEEDYGSIVRALWASKNRSKEKQASGPRYGLFLTLRKGMGSLIDRLFQANQEAGIELKTHSRVERIFHDGKEWTIHLKSGGLFKANGIVLAVPAPEASRILEPHEPEISGKLRAIPYHSVVTVNFLFRRSDVNPGLKTFGFVVPAMSGFRTIGGTFSSQKFQGRAASEAVSLRLFMGGFSAPDFADLTDGEILKAAREELAALTGISGEPLSCLIRHFDQAMPQYETGHLNRIRVLKSFLEMGPPALWMTGNAFRGFGIPDCIRQAKATADAVLRSVLRINQESGEAFESPIRGFEGSCRKG